jgi:hypothetical protein
MSGADPAIDHSVTTITDSRRLVNQSAEMAGRDHSALFGFDIGRGLALVPKAGRQYFRLRELRRVC